MIGGVMGEYIYDGYSWRLLRNLIDSTFNIPLELMGDDFYLPWFEFVHDDKLLRVEVGDSLLIDSKMNIKLIKKEE